jgi:hypothetical protein
MNMGVTLNGVQQTLAGMQREVDGRRKVFRSGIIAAGMELEAACTQKLTEVLYSIPEDDDKERKRTGNLRASRFTMWTGGPTPSTPSFVGIAGEESVAAGHAEAVSNGKEMVDANSSPSRTAVVVGYGAYYAIFVHEGVEGKFDGFKWVELALAEVRGKMIARMTGQAVNP